MSTQQNPVHDTKRCPDCDTYGTVVDVDSRSDDLAMAQAAGATESKDWEKVRYRTYECGGCGTKWDYYK